MKPADHSARMARVHQTLEGVRVGDSFGQTFFIPEEQRLAQVDARQLPDAPWYYTDDTAMSVSVAQILEQYGEIRQDELVQLFSIQYAQDPRRAYGGSIQFLLRSIAEGGDWRKLSREQFDGMGSWGNGGAMRSAVVGAYFADNEDRIIREASLQAEITHAHEEGIAGAVAVALAAGIAMREGQFRLAEVAEKVSMLTRAANLSRSTQPAHAAKILGNGIGLRAADTVPLALWVAEKFGQDFESAMWALVAVGGDRDTTCAIAGGVMAAAGAKIPALWSEKSEALPG